MTTIPTEHPAARSRPRRLTTLLVAPLLLLAACGDTSNGNATGTVPPAATPPATSEPAASGRPPASVETVIGHVEMLAGEIGVRFAATEGEREAAAYIEDVLADAGYDTELQEFEVNVRYDDSSVTLPGGGPSAEPIDALMLQGSAATPEEGPDSEADPLEASMIFGGLGHSSDLEGIDVSGRVLVVERGITTFAEKVQEAEARGALALVIVNNQPGPLQGTLGDYTASIPVIGVPFDRRDELINAAAAGDEISLEAAAGARQATSQNVVGRSDGECQAYLGAHYDSVQAGPGANDNASGTALMLELARAHYSEGLCAIAFGSEEIGLFGSQAFVREHDVEDAMFMLNIDMVGKITDAIIVGDDVLANRIDLLLDRSGTYPIDPGVFPPYSASDHVSFTAVGVPAVTLHSGNDPLIHTGQDDLDNVSAESLEIMLEIGEVALEGLLRDLERETVAWESERAALARTQAVG